MFYKTRLYKNRIYHHRKRGLDPTLFLTIRRSAGGSTAAHPTVRRRTSRRQLGEVLCHFGAGHQSIFIGMCISIDIVLI